MCVDLSSLSNSKWGTGFALGAGRLVPPRMGHAIAHRIAGRVAARRCDAMVQAVRANQWMASRGTLTGEALDAAVRQMFENDARFLYDLYHVADDPDALMAMVDADETFEQVAERDREGAFVYAALHLGNFDLMGRALAATRGWRPQLLTVADPNGGYVWQNDMRGRYGFEVTPVTMGSLKQAARGLGDGVSVLTGMDRPIPDARQRPRFFGREAPLPVLHVRMAMRARVPVVVLCAPQTERGTYCVRGSEPIEMEIGRDMAGATLVNAERLLLEAERLIERWPQQWAMPHAVWPDVVGTV